MNPILAHAQEFIWRNARLIDRYLFAYWFGDGKAEPVLAALAAYQNADGGFGNALEPDKRAPTSQPVDVEIAFHILDDLDGFDHPMVLPACDFLDSISTSEGGVPFALPSVKEYPHAPWWQVPDDPPAALNPTAAIAGLLLKHSVRHPWVERATRYCWQAIAGTDTREFHDLIPMITFLDHAPDRNRAEQELARLVERILEPGVVTYEPEAEGYVHLPLEWAPSPSSFCRGLFSAETIQMHLEALAARQQEDGGWPIKWEALSPGVEMEWRGWVTIQSLKTLRAYGKI